MGRESKNEGGRSGSKGLFWGRPVGSFLGLTLPETVPLLVHTRNFLSGGVCPETTAGHGQDWIQLCWSQGQAFPLQAFRMVSLASNGQSAGLWSSSP